MTFPSREESRTRSTGREGHNAPPARATAGESVKERGADPRFPGWAVLPPSVVPESVQRRAVAVLLVPLLPEEAKELFGPAREVGGLDRQILQLIAEGASAEAIGRTLGIQPRRVYRRLASLRDRFGVGTTRELVALVAPWGFSGPSGN